MLKVNFDSDESGVAQALRANKFYQHIVFKEGRGWMTWNFLEQRWKDKEYFTYLVDQVAAKFKLVEYGGPIAKRMGNVTSMERILKMLTHMHEFTEAKWDSDSFLIGTANKVVNAKSLVFREQRPNDYISISVPVRYDEMAKCSRFEEFIKQILPNEELAHYVQKLLGSGLLPLSPQQLFHFWHGDGANGKSVLRGVVQDVLGPLSGSVPTSIFIRGSDESSNRFSLSRVQDSRLIFASEIPGGKALEDYRVKQLTGEDSVVVEEKGRPQQEVTFFATVIMLVNDIPTISDNSPSMRRRLRVVPFTQSFAGRQDDTLRTKLLGEREGILAWLIRGANMYLEEGLNDCPIIDKATDEAIRSSFSLHDFLTEILEPDVDGRVAAKDIMDKYRAYQRERGMPANISNKVFGDAMLAFAGKDSKVGGSGGYGVAYRGWRFKSDMTGMVTEGLDMKF